MTRRTDSGWRSKPGGRIDYREGRDIIGNMCDPPSPIEALTYRCMERLQHICIPKVEDEQIGSAMGVPLAPEEHAIGMLYVDRRPDASPFTPADLDLLSALGQHVALRLEAIIQKQIRQQAEAAATEVTVAHEIQARLEPKALPQFEGLQVAAYRSSGRSQCRDIYDMIRLPNGIAATIIGHAIGDGADPALMMAETRAAFRVSALHGDAPHALMRQLNWLIFDVARAQVLRCCELFIDPKTGLIRYCAAGQTGAFIVDARGGYHELPTGEQPELGSRRDAVYRTSTAKLDRGEILALYTRGATTITNADGIPYGRERLIELICDGFGQPAGTNLADVIADIRNYSKGGQQPDDITIVLFSRD